MPFKPRLNHSFSISQFSTIIKLNFSPINIITHYNYPPLNPTSPGLGTYPPGWVLGRRFRHRGSSRRGRCGSRSRGCQARRPGCTGRDSSRAGCTHTHSPAGPYPGPESCCPGSTRMPSTRSHSLTGQVWSVLWSVGIPVRLLQGTNQTKSIVTNLMCNRFAFLMLLKLRIKISVNKNSTYCITDGISLKACDFKKKSLPPHDL